MADEDILRIAAKKEDGINLTQRRKDAKRRGTVERREVTRE